MNKRTSRKPKSPSHADTRPDPLTQAFKEYWRNVDAGKNHTNAALYVLRDYGLAMNDKQFRRCARRIKSKIAEAKDRQQGERDYYLIEHLVRHRFKESLESWDQFDAAFSACGLPTSMLASVKRYLQADGYDFAVADAMKPVKK
jgi:hypothetical protein